MFYSQLSQKGSCLTERLLKQFDNVTLTIVHLSDQHVLILLNEQINYPQSVIMGDILSCWQAISFPDQMISVLISMVSVFGEYPIFLGVPGNTFDAVSLYALILSLTKAHQNREG